MKVKRDIAFNVPFLLFQLLGIKRAVLEFNNYAIIGRLKAAHDQPGKRTSARSLQLFLTLPIECIRR